MAGTKQWRAADGRLQPGFQTAGFTLKQVGKLQALGAQTLYFEHEKSGASLFYIRNKDTNRGFSISYRTPHLDETDTNHVFEHSVLPLINIRVRIFFLIFAARHTTHL